MQPFKMESTSSNTPRKTSSLASPLPGEYYRGCRKEEVGQFWSYSQEKVCDVAVCLLFLLESHIEITFAATSFSFLELPYTNRHTLLSSHPKINPLQTALIDMFDFYSLTNNRRPRLAWLSEAENIPLELFRGEIVLAPNREDEFLRENHYTSDDILRRHQLTQNSINRLVSWQEESTYDDRFWDAGDAFFPGEDDLVDDEDTWADDEEDETLLVNEETSLISREISVDDEENTSVDDDSDDSPAYYTANGGLADSDGFSIVGYHNASLDEPVVDALCHSSQHPPQNHR